jgi:ABC-2 type transport system ATP-binding protein
VNLEAPPPTAGRAPGAPAEAHGTRPGPGLIIARGVTRRFGTKLALEPIDVVVRPGAVTGLLGPNGSGKSTFMRCLVGLVRADAGEVSVDGVQLVGDGTAVRRQVTYAPGELHLYGELTGRDHLAFLLRGRDRAALGRAEAIARDFGLPLDQRVRGYSHGMKRQLVFAAALAPDVRVRILDEISEGLDPSKRSELLDRIDAEARAGRTILLSSHHLGEVDRVCARLLFLNAGRLVADESAAAIALRSARRMAVDWPSEEVARAAARRLSDQAAGSHTGASAHRDDPGTRCVADVYVQGARTSFTLASDDPRPFLDRLQAARELPAPRAIEHGRMSLTDLYRDLYGVEGT